MSVHRLKSFALLLLFFSEIADSGFHSIFQWKPSPWSECNQRDQKSLSSCCQCHRTRTMTCALRSNQRQVPPYYCRKLLADVKAPALRELCSPCRQDCVLSSWSDWSPCSQSCTPALRHRTRTLLLEATGDGRPCDPFVEVEECRELATCAFLDPRPRFSWRVGDWSSCRRLTRETSCGFGKRFRAVDCLDSSSTPVPQAFCDYHINALSNEKSTPNEDEDCLLPCDCLVGPWSPWGPCSQTCSKGSQDMGGYQTRSRGVVQEAVRGGVVCPELIQRKSCQLSILPPCPRYIWRLGEWRECEMERSTSQMPCGAGMQTRWVYCTQEQDPLYRPVEDLLCVQHSWFYSNTSGVMKPAEERACQVSCPRHCELGEWQAWSDCSQSCGRDGVRRRIKPVLVEPFGEGETCGINMETKPCEATPCSWWHIGSWSRCFVNGQKEACATGSQQRTVYCMSALGAYLPDHNCSSPRPLSTRSCHVPCDDDCPVTTWSTWAPCSVTCGARGGVQTRTRSLLASGTSDLACLQNDELSQQQVCGKKACVSYGWQVSAWSPCLTTQTNATSHDCATNTGRQTRDVFCERGNDPVEVASDELCSHGAPPITERICTPPCPRDCELSEWSEWSACSHDCGRHSVKVRSRRIQRLSQHGGSQCPGRADSNGLVVQEKQCKNLPECEVLTWFSGDWSVCQPNSACGYGSQRRHVACTSSTNAENNRRLADCLAAGLVNPPPEERPCFVPCPGDCILTQWSSFTPCNQTCGNEPRTRLRTRQLLNPDALLTFDEMCPHLANAALRETEACDPVTCPSYTWESGRWGTCTPLAQHNESQMQRDCGHGMKRRHVFCLRGDGTHVPTHHCDDGGSMPVRETPCDITCPQNCNTTPWSAWTSCSRDCGNGTKTRWREVRQFNSSRGRPCPHLEETIRCERLPCEMLEWHVGQYGECEPHNGQQCGPGNQRRIVQCLAGPMFHDLCELYSPRPSASVACDKPCSNDCHMGEWSQMSSCSCGPTRSVWYRTREVLLPPKVAGKPCGPTNDTEPCFCWKYTLSLGNWTTCKPDNRGADCGLGVRRRHLECLRDDNLPVTLDRCILDPDFDFRLFNMSLEEPCEVVCARDCQLSPFTDWSGCDAACGVRAMKARKRDVVMPPNEMGRKCPAEDELMQVVPCRSSPCFTYSWSRGTWSHCTVPPHQCGQGERNRTMQCVRSDGSPMPDHKCLLAHEVDLSEPEKKRLDLHTAEACGVPCPGDCQMTEWTGFGPCFKTCAGGITHGKQYRSRGILISASGGRSCPTRTVEFRDCDKKTAECPVFEWHTGNWGGNGRRKVHCLLSSGDKVDGGCISHLKPSHLLRCTEDCSKYALCEDGACSCLTGFTGDGLTCLPEAGCVTNDNCVLNDSYCDTVNRRCVCPGGRHPRQDMVCGPVADRVDDRERGGGMDALFVYILIGALALLLLCGLVLAFLLVRWRRRRKPLNEAPNLRKVDSLEAVQISKQTQQNITNHHLANSTYIPADPGLSDSDLHNPYPTYVSNASGFSSVGGKNLDDVISTTSSGAPPRKFNKPSSEMELHEDIYADSPEASKSRRLTLNSRERNQRSPCPPSNGKDWVPHYEGPMGQGMSLPLTAPVDPTKSVSPSSSQIVRVPSVRSVKTDGCPDGPKLSTFKPAYEDELTSALYPVTDAQPYKPNQQHTYHLQHPGTISPSLSSTLPRNYQQRALPAIPTSFAGAHPPPAFVPTTLPSTYTSTTLPSPRTKRAAEMRKLNENGRESPLDVPYASQAAASSDRVRCRTPTATPASELLMYCDELLADLEKVANT